MSVEKCIKASEKHVKRSSTLAGPRDNEEKYKFT